MRMCSGGQEAAGAVACHRAHRARIRGYAQAHLAARQALVCTNILGWVGRSLLGAGAGTEQSLSLRIVNGASLRTRARASPLPAHHARYTTRVVRPRPRVRAVPAANAAALQPPQAAPPPACPAAHPAMHPERPATALPSSLAAMPSCRPRSAPRMHRRVPSALHTVSAPHAEPHAAGAPPIRTERLPHGACMLSPATLTDGGSSGYVSERSGSRESAQRLLRATAADR
jgi:hypothetical protein